MEIDIFMIDKKIRDIWNESQKNITNIEKCIEDCNELLVNNDISLHVKNDILQKIKELKLSK
jgi:signal recognition particle GTPase